VYKSSITKKVLSGRSERSRFSDGAASCPYDYLGSEFHTKLKK